jgi:hypothetical protein
MGLRKARILGRTTSGWIWQEQRGRKKKERNSRKEGIRTQNTDIGINKRQERIDEIRG